MNNILISSFHTSDWYSSEFRIKKQFNVLKEKLNNVSLFLQTEKDLPIEWNKRFKTYINNYGYALWTWKPLVILQALSKIDNNDTLIYIDGGSSIPVINIDEFIIILQKKIDLLKLSFSQIGIGYNYKDKNNIRSIRKQILNDFNLTNDKYFLYDYPHYESGGFIINKNDNAIDFFKSWYNFMYDNFESSILSDFQDKTNQFSEFIHNDADQAVMECLLYINQKKDKKYFTDLNSFFYDWNIYTRIKGKQMLSNKINKRLKCNIFNHLFNNKIS